VGPEWGSEVAVDVNGGGSILVHNVKSGKPLGARAENRCTQANTKRPDKESEVSALIVYSPLCSAMRIYVYTPNNNRQQNMSQPSVWLACLLSGCLSGCLAGCLAGWLAVWLAIRQLSGQLAGWLAGWPAGRNLPVND